MDSPTFDKMCDEISRTTSVHSLRTGSAVSRAASRYTDPNPEDLDDDEAQDGDVDIAGAGPDGALNDGQDGGPPGGGGTTGGSAAQGKDLGKLAARPRKQSFYYNADGVRLVC